MTGKKPPNPPKSAPSQPESDQQKRLAQALKRNLARRKQAAAAKHAPAHSRGDA